MSVSVEVDSRTASERLKNLTRRVKRLEVPFRKAGQYLARETEKQFDQEKDFNGMPWRPLKPATWKYKKGDKILTETGAMRSSFYYDASGKSLKFGLQDEKAKFHQGTRPIIGMNKKRLDEITKIIKAHVKKKK